MDIEFKPTYLMIKKHKKTGMLYFCKTYAYNPDKYKGSGVYWRLHLEKHGRDVEHVWKKLFHDYEETLDFALSFSEIFNIVDNPNWANLVPEDGVSGHPPGSVQPQTQGSLNKHYDDTIYFFENRKTGEVVKATRTDFYKKYNLASQNVHGLIKGTRKTVQGWTIQGTKTNKKPVIIEDVVYAGSTEAANELGLTRASIKARLKSKNYPTYNYLVTI